MITAHACAKIILVGEHAVVYGQPAIAIPVASLQATVTVQPHTDNWNTLQIVAEDESILYTPETHSESPLIQMAHSVLNQLDVDIPRLTLTIKSQIPIASGLGSGAAISTAVGRALLQWHGTQVDKSTLNRLVYDIEKIYHGTPSGIDNSVIVYEQPVYFVRDQPIEYLDIGQSFSLLIANSGKSALTRESVGDVRKLYNADPDRIIPIIESIGSIVRRARQTIEIGDAETLGHLMTENHGLLQQLTVSSPELDQLVGAALNAGAFGAKLSGGGRGGNMIALVEPSRQEQVKSALLGAGAVQIYPTDIE